MKMPQTLTIRGETYKVRYFTTSEDGKTIAVLDTDKLEGPYGDEYPMEKVSK